MNQTLQQLKERKSVRVFTDAPIKPEAVSAILESAVNAPTAGNQQLYTILDITDTLNTFDLCVDVYPHDSPDLTTRSQEELEGLLESWMAVTYESYDEYFEKEFGITPEIRAQLIERYTEVVEG